MFKMFLIKYSVFLYFIFNFLFVNVLSNENDYLIEILCNSDIKESDVEQKTDISLKIFNNKSRNNNLEELIVAMHPCFEDSSDNESDLNDSKFKPMTEIRVKREPKISSRPSFLILNRRNRDKSQIKIRRKSMQDVRFKHMHSTGIKQKMPNEQVNRFKRSVNNGNFDELITNDQEVSNATKQEVILNFNNTVELDEVLNISKSVINVPNKVNSTEQLDSLSLEGNHIKNETNTVGSLNDIEVNMQPDETTKLNILDITHKTFEEDKLSTDPQQNEEVKNDQNSQIAFNSSSTFNDREENNTTIKSIKTSDIIPKNVSSETTPITFLSDEERDSNRTGQSQIKKQLLFNQTIFDSEIENIKRNVSLSEKDQIEHESNVRNRQQLEETKNFEKIQIHMKNETVNITIQSNGAEQLTNNQNLTTLKPEISSQRTKTKIKFKQVKPNPNLVKWIKGNTLQLPVITMPLRKCPQGHRIRQGKCVQVY